MEALKCTGMTANPDKCTQGAQTLTYLGHRVGRGLVKVPEARIPAIKKVKQPLTKRDLRAFLGSVGHYGSFVPNIAGRAVPLYNALKKVAPSKLEWIGYMYDAYDYFLHTLCSHHVLCLPREDDTFVLQIDASYREIGAIISERWGGETGGLLLQEAAAG